MTLMLIVLLVLLVLAAFWMGMECERAGRKALDEANYLRDRVRR